MTEKLKTLSEIRNELADQALEKEVYEKGHGFLEKPYSRYRFHNGFSDGFDAGVAEMKKRAEVLVELLDQARLWNDQRGVSSIKSALEAYRKATE